MLKCFALFSLDVRPSALPPFHHPPLPQPTNPNLHTNSPTLLRLLYHELVHQVCFLVLCLATMRVAAPQRSSCGYLDAVSCVHYTLTILSITMSWHQGMQNYLTCVGICHCVAGDGASSQPPAHPPKDAVRTQPDNRPELSESKLPLLLSLEPSTLSSSVACSLRTCRSYRLSRRRRARG